MMSSRGLMQITSKTRTKNTRVHFRFILRISSGASSNDADDTVRHTPQIMKGPSPLKIQMQRAQCSSTTSFTLLTWPTCTISWSRSTSLKQARMSTEPHLLCLHMAFFMSTETPGLLPYPSVGDASQGVYKSVDCWFAPNFPTPEPSASEEGLSPLSPCWYLKSCVWLQRILVMKIILNLGLMLRI